MIVYPTYAAAGDLGKKENSDPSWTPTANIRKRYQTRGVIWLRVMPAGPENSMGHGKYLIYGAYADFGIRVNSGCIRLRPADIETRFNLVPHGTRMQMINDLVKISVKPDSKRYVQVQQP